MRCQQRQTFKPYSKVSDTLTKETGRVSEVFDHDTVVVQYPSSEKTYCNAQSELRVQNDFRKPGNLRW